MNKKLSLVVFLVLALSLFVVLTGCNQDQVLEALELADTSSTEGEDATAEETGRTAIGVKPTSDEALPLAGGMGTEL